MEMVEKVEKEEVVNKENCDVKNGDNINNLDIYLNPMQTKLLIEVSKSLGKISALKIGRKVYLTAVSGYNTLVYLKGLGFIDLFRRHNMSIAKITQRGINYLANLNVSNILNVSKDL